MIKKRRYVYRLTFPNGMFYFGSTYSVEERWGDNGTHYRGQPVYEAIERYGWDNIKKEVLLYLSNNDTLVKEVELALIKDNMSQCYNAQCNVEWDKEHPKKKANTATYTHVWTIDGVTMTAREWCKEYGKSYAATVGRGGAYGMTPKEALTFPPVPKGMTKNALEYWKSLGLTPGTDTTSYVTPKSEFPSWIVARGA